MCHDECPESPEWCGCSRTCVGCGHCVICCPNGHPTAVVIQTFANGEVPK